MSLTSYRAAPPRVTKDRCQCWDACGAWNEPRVGAGHYEEELVGTRFEDLAMTYSPTP